MKNTLKKLGLLVLLIASFIACDKDYNAIGTDLLTNSNFITDSAEFPALTYNKVVLPVKSNNLSSSLLGVYNDPVYGMTTAGIVVQLLPTSYDVTFGDEIEIDSIILTLPYFSHKTGDVDDEGNAIYELDSVFGNEVAPIKLSIYENKYFLRDYDPATNLEEPQKYYSNSNQTINFDNFLGDMIYQTDYFLPLATEIVLGGIDEETNEFEETDRIAPAFRVDLIRGIDGEVNQQLYDYWNNLIFAQEGDPVLSNSNNFVDYFRGIYMKAEAINGDGNMTLLDFVNRGANITIYYTYLYSSTSSGGEPVEERREKEFKMNLSGNKVNVMENNFGVTLTDGDALNGDESIYLKGMEGSMGVVKLFDGIVTDENGDHDALDYFYETFKNADGTPKRLINEANLVLYVDQNIVNNSGEEPDRLMLYDLKNKIPVIDYYADPTLNTTTPRLSKLVYSRILERNEDDNGIYYKFRLTEHLNNILLRDSLNLDLGIVVTGNINSIDQLDLEGTDESSTVQIIPLGSFLSPRGTVLYGSNENVPEDKRLKLEIFYSELED